MPLFPAHEKLLGQCKLCESTGLAWAFVAQVPRIQERLTTFAASFETSAQLAEAAAVLAAHAAAQAELVDSGCFRAALAAALALGNFLNHGSRLGQAAGFRLRNLPKLQVTTRDYFPRPALHHFSHRSARQHGPSLLVFHGIVLPFYYG